MAFGQKVTEVRVSGGGYQLPSLTIQAQSNTVPIEVVVRGSDGSTIGTLQRDNFRVLVDGKSVPVSSFTVQGGATEVRFGLAPTAAAAKSSTTAASGPPRFVGLFFDDVSTDAKSLELARKAALAFLPELGPSDRVAVLTASGRQNLNFTGAKSTSLAVAIAQIRPHPRASQRGMLTCPRITPFEAYQITALHSPPAIEAVMHEAIACTGGQDKFFRYTGNLNQQAALEPLLAQAQATWDLTRGASEDIQSAIAQAVATLAHQPGRRILLLTSSGFLTESLEGEQDQIIRSALRNDVVLNALDATGLSGGDPTRPLNQESDAGILPLITFFYEETSKFPQRQAEDDVMVHLAQGTGGLFFHNSNDLALGFRRLGLAPQFAYDLALAPASLPADGKFHAIKVELAPAIHGAIVQARRGYFDPPPVLPGAHLAADLDRAMRGQDEATAVPVTLVVREQAGKLGVSVHFAVSGMDFAKTHGRLDQRLLIVAGLFSDDGRFITGQQGAMDLDLTQPTYKRFLTQGLSASLIVGAAPGSYRLRVVVGESSSGKMSSFNRSVQLH